MMKYISYPNSYQLIRDNFPDFTYAPEPLSLFGLLAHWALTKTVLRSCRKHIPDVWRVLYLKLYHHNLSI